MSSLSFRADFDLRVIKAIPPKRRLPLHGLIFKAFIFIMTMTLLSPFSDTMDVAVGFFIYMPPTRSTRVSCDAGGYTQWYYNKFNCKWDSTDVTRVILLRC